MWAVYADPPAGTTRTLVDAHSGDVVSVERIAQHVDGEGVVFDFADAIANPRAFSATNTFTYNRSQTEFSQVMTYHQVTRAQVYIQSLGFRQQRSAGRRARRVP